MSTPPARDISPALRSRASFEGLPPGSVGFSNFGEAVDSTGHFATGRQSSQCSRAGSALKNVSVRYCVHISEWPIAVWFPASTGEGELCDKDACSKVFLAPVVFGGMVVLLLVAADGYRMFQWPSCQQRHSPAGRSYGDDERESGVDRSWKFFRADSGGEQCHVGIDQRWRRAHGHVGGYGWNAIRYSGCDDDLYRDCHGNRRNDDSYRSGYGDGESRTDGHDCGESYIDYCGKLFRTDGGG
jgi:hypothetical protein